MWDIFFGLGILFLWTTATGMGIYLTRRLIPTRRDPAIMSLVSESASRCSFTSESSDPSSLTRVTLMTSLTPEILLPTRGDSRIHDVTDPRVITWAQFFLQSDSRSTFAGTEYEYEDLAWSSSLRHGGPTWCALVLWGAYLMMCRLRLLLASDVELNPGPNDVINQQPTGSPEESDTSGMNFSANSRLLSDILQDSEAGSQPPARPQPAQPDESSMQQPSTHLSPPLIQLESPTTDVSFVTGATVTSTQVKDITEGGSPNLLPLFQPGSTMLPQQQQAMSQKQTPQPQKQPLQVQQPSTPFQKTVQYLRQPPQDDTQSGLAPNPSEAEATTTTFKSTFSTTLNSPSNLTPSVGLEDVKRSNSTDMCENSNPETILLKELGPVHAEMFDTMTESQFLSAGGTTGLGVSDTTSWGSDDAFWSGSQGGGGLWGGVGEGGEMGLVCQAGIQADLECYQTHKLPSTSSMG